MKFRGITYPTEVGSFWESTEVRDVFVVGYVSCKVYDVYPDQEEEAELRAILDRRPNKLIFDLGRQTNCPSTHIQLWINALREVEERAEGEFAYPGDRTGGGGLFAYFTELEQALEAMVQQEAIAQRVAFCSANENLLNVLRVLRLIRSPA